MSSRPRRYTPNGGFGSSHFPEEDNRSDDGNDLDIDFSITESGRTVAHVIAGMKGEGSEAHAMDISITASGRSVVEDVSDQQQPEDQQHPRRTTRSAAKAIPEGEAAGSFESSGSGFVSGLMNANGTNNSSTTASNTEAVSHTPPAGSSYETRHFGKRPRTGSVSGRLRSASDLEDKGIIDRSQKGVLKDLIISGDEALQKALDKYEKGDRSQLEAMIKSGLLAQKLPLDMDLLGDLDLDFLTVDDATIGSLGNQNLEHAGGKKALPPMVSGIPSSGNSVDFADGIGELDFSVGGGDLESYRNSRSNSIDLDGFRLRSNSMRSDFEFRSRSNSLAFDPRDRSNSTATNNSLAMDPRDRSNSLAMDPRDRSNSLGFSALQNEDASSNAHHQRWMDRPVPGKEQPSPALRKAPNAPMPVSGIGASLAEYNSRTQTKLTKAQMAEEKRQERQRKKEEKEREKQEAKERREREKQEKRQQKEVEKRQRKTKKVQKAKLKDDDADETEKIVESGTGRPRSMSDPNLRTSIDSDGLLQVERPDGWVGAYSPESRKLRIDRFMEKRNHRVWTKSVKYDVRKNFADSRLRVKGRFVKKEDELLMRELMSLT